MGKNNSGDLDKERLWHMIIRLSAGISFAVLMTISIIFSANGFGFVASSAYEWIGYPVAIFLVAVPEFLFNNGYHTDSKTMTLVAYLGYTWGILSNCIGFWIAFGSVDPTQPGMLIKGSLALFFSAILGTLLEISPFAFLKVAVGIEGDGKDFISQLIIQINGDGGSRSYQTSSRNNNKPSSLSIPGVSRGMGFQMPKTTTAPVSQQRPSKPIFSVCPRCGNRNVAKHGNHMECIECGWESSSSDD